MNALGGQYIIFQDLIWTSQLKTITKQLLCIRCHLETTVDGVVGSDPARGCSRHSHLNPRPH